MICLILVGLYSLVAMVFEVCSTAHSDAYNVKTASDIKASLVKTSSHTTAICASAFHLSAPILLSIISIWMFYRHRQTKNFLYFKEVFIEKIHTVLQSN